MIMEQTGCKTNKNNRVTRKDIGLSTIKMIDDENKPPQIVRKTEFKKPTRFSPGFCKICGERFSMITNSHAEKHGFRNANEMANSDKVVFGVWSK